MDTVGIFHAYFMHACAFFMHKICDIFCFSSCIYNYFVYHWTFWTLYSLHSSIECKNGIWIMRGVFISVLASLIKCLTPHDFKIFSNSVTALWVKLYCSTHIFNWSASDFWDTNELELTFFAIVLYLFWLRLFIRSTFRSLFKIDCTPRNKRTLFRACSVLFLFIFGIFCNVISVICNFRIV